MQPDVHAWRDECRPTAWWPSKNDTRTRILHMSPLEITHWFAKPCEAMPKEKLPGWSACTCKGTRASANVTELAAFVVDADGVPVSLAEALEALPCAAIGHTSASHGIKPGNRWRIVVWPDRSLTPSEYRACWPVIVDLFAGIGVEVDRKCSDLCRLWFVPTEGPHYEHGANDREPLPVAELLALAPRETSEPGNSRFTKTAKKAGGDGQEQASGRRGAPLAPASHTRPVAERVASYLARVEPARILHGRAA